MTSRLDRRDARPAARGVAARARATAGRKLLVPYVTGGLGDDWVDVVRAVADAGADAIEIGIPFSDPVMDGPTIQEASRAGARRRARRRASILDELARRRRRRAARGHDLLQHRLPHGPRALRRRRCADAGVGGGDPARPAARGGRARGAAAADAAGVETVLLAAPTTPDERLPRVCARARGFVYARRAAGRHRRARRRWRRRRR